MITRFLWFILHSTLESFLSKIETANQRIVFLYLFSDWLNLPKSKKNWIDYQLMQHCTVNYQDTVSSLQPITIFLISRTNGGCFGQINPRGKVYLWILVILQQLLQNILRNLQKLIDILKQRPMIISRYQILPLLQCHNESFNTKIQCTYEMLFSID